MYVCMYLIPGVAERAREVHGAEDAEQLFGRPGQGGAARATGLQKHRRVSLVHEGLFAEMHPIEYIRIFICTPSLLDVLGRVGVAAGGEEGVHTCIQAAHYRSSKI